MVDVVLLCNGYQVFKETVTDPTWALSTIATSYGRIYAVFCVVDYVVYMSTEHSNTTCVLVYGGP